MQSPTSRTFPYSSTTSMFNAFTSPNSSHAANTGGGSQRGSNRATPVRGSSNSTIRPVIATESSGYWTLKSRRGLEEEENKARVQKIPTAPAAAMHWSSVVTHGEKPRSTRAHTATVVGDLVIVFGGCDATSCFDDLYIFDTDTMYWSKPEVIGDIPPPCRAHSSQLVDRRLFIFGGGDGPNYFNNLYIFDTATLTWEKPTLKGDIPGPRRAHTTCIWDKHVYVFGGGDGIQALRDVYKLSTEDSNLTWTRVETHGTAPIPRGYHTSNLIGSKLVVFGGSDGHECFSDIHVLDLETRNWIAVDVECSIPRLAHTATQIGSYLFVIGGHDGSKYSQDVLLLNLVTMCWETRKVYGEIPSGRGYHTSVLVDSRVFVIGGYDGKTVHDSVYILDLSACAYLPQIAVFELGINPRL